MVLEASREENTSPKETMMSSYSWLANKRRQCSNIAPNISMHKEQPHICMNIEKLFLRKPPQQKYVTLNNGLG